MSAGSSSSSSQTSLVPSSAHSLPLFNAYTKKDVPFSSTFPSQPFQASLVVMMRRFGCILCRHSALRISRNESLFRSNNIRLIAIAPEMLGLEEFQEGKYWSGELFVDREAKVYSQLEIQRLGIFKGLGALFNSDVKQAYNDAKADGVTGNYKGDGFRLGATYLIGPGGEIWFEHKMKHYADQPSLEEIQNAAKARIANWKEGNIDNSEDQRIEQQQENCQGMCS